MHGITRALGAAVALSFLGGCASIIKGTTHDVSINSNPTGASVKIYKAEGGALVAEGTTPYVAPLKRGDGFFAKGRYRVVIEKPGLPTREIAIDASVNGWYIAGNLLLGGLIGWLIIDPATGAMWSLDPDQINVDLGAPAPQGEKTAMLLKDEVPPALHALMKPLPQAR
ncbi:MAG TPA: hypothetical protein VFI16_05895 [Anaeromyxobacteraceae bacterium]|nr:hypothetical protein [Anaeromyxobacteraceae bacterium]